MPTSRLDVSTAAIHDLLPMIGAVCRVIGSDQNESADCVRLIVDGAAIPEDAALVTCNVERREDGNSVSLTATFQKVA